MIERAQPGKVVVPIFLGQRQVAAARIQPGAHVTVHLAGRDQVGTGTAAQNGLALQFLKDVATVVVSFDEEQALALLAEIRKHGPRLEERERRQAKSRIA